MTTLVIDRTTPINDILALMGAPRARIDVDKGHGTIAPVIDPDDYDNDTNYLCAIPGMAERLIKGMNTPLSECETVPAECFHV
ncbi:MAG: hypothetical protein LBB74_05310 [Chitinispirillales bacterium]|jgi:hypothetical protein|nr:hypothetical protein [Chitinispirillales bacterium]